MKEYWQRLETKIDAMSLRQRAMAFGIAALVLITLVNTVMLDPLLAQQKQYSQQVKLDQQQISAIQAEIQLRVASHDMDPDAPSRARLQTLKQQSAKLREDLMGMQKGLVSPDKMASLLEDLLRKNGRLRLTSLKTLPVSLLNDSAEQSAQSPGGRKTLGTSPLQKSKPETRQSADAVYKHGVEIVVQGSYPDMVDYLTDLESMPWQLFWANAKLNVDSYPKSSLTLTLFTLSLDKKWLHI
jgi:MSHA biogenesis protein MshJ